MTAPDLAAWEARHARSWRRRWAAALRVVCPACQAAAGEPCLSPPGRLRWSPHPDRGRAHTSTTAVDLSPGRQLDLLDLEATS